MEDVSQDEKKEAGQEAEAEINQKKKELAEVKGEDKSPMEKADDRIAAMKEQNDRLEKNMARQERIISEQKLEGRGNAGGGDQAEETPKEYKDRILRNDE